MKNLLTLSLALVVVTACSGQVFRPGAGRGGAPGGHAGHAPTRIGPAGHHHGGYVYRHAPRVVVAPRPYYRPSYYGVYSYYPGYGTDYPYFGSYGYYGDYGYPRAASTGFWLGALAGGVIGHNSGDFGHHGWRGAAWGAGAGWLLGSIVDAHRRPAVAAPVPAAPVVAAPVPAAAAPAAPAAAPQQVTIINHYYQSSSPMSGANSLFGR